MSSSISRKHAFKIGWYFFKPYKIRMGLLFLFILVSGISETINLAVLYPIMNYGLDLPESNSFLINFFKPVIEIIDPENSFRASCYLLCIVSIFTVGTKYLYYRYSYRLMIHITGQIQKNVFSKLIEADYGFFSSTQQGRLIHTATIAPDHVYNLVLSSMRVTYDGLNAAIMFLFLCYLNAGATFAIIIIGLLYSVVIKKVMKEVIYKSALISTEQERIKNVLLNEFITGIKTIKVFDVCAYWRDRFYSAVEKSLFNKYKMLMGRIYPETGMKLLFYFILAVIGIILSYKATNDMITIIPTFGTFVIVMSRFIPVLQQAGNSFMTLADSMPNSNLVYELCNQNFGKVDDEGEIAGNFSEKIKFEDVSFSYPATNRKVLDAINFEIKSKNITAIVGSSGAGKTTIINLLLRIYSPDSGRITFDGNDIEQFSKASYLSKIGFVSQDTFIFNDTVRKNICFGLEGCTDEQIQNAAKLANAHEFIEKLHLGYETIVGDAGMKLSGGQKQRIAIARAILRLPEIIIFDEATSSLDNISEAKIQDAINNIAKHTTVILIAHRLTTVQHADNIILLENGKVLEQGTHQNLLENKGKYYQFFMAKESLSPFEEVKTSKGIL